MKVKKLLSLVTALSMMPMAYSAIAAEVTTYKGDSDAKPGSWAIEYHQENTAWNTQQDYVGVGYGIGKDESNAIVANIASPTEAHRYIALTPALTGAFEANSTYRIGVWANGSGIANGMVFRLDWTYEAPFGQFTKSDAAENNGLSYYYYDVAVGDTVPTALKIYFNQKMNYVLDGISVQKLADGTSDGAELVANGEIDTVGYNFDVASENTRLSQDWTTVYNEEHGKFDKTRDLAKPTKKYARTGDYALYMHNDTPIPEGGNTYFRVKNVEVAHAGDNRYGNFQLTEGDYKLELWAKCDHLTVISAGVPWFKDGNLKAIKTDTVDENGWVKYETTVNVTAEEIEKRGYGTTRFNEYFTFIIEGVGEIVVDDVKFYKVGEENNNLVVDGGFENSLTTVAAADGFYAYSDENKGNNLPFIQYVGVPDVTMQGTKYYAEPTDREAYDGKYSMHIVNTVSDASNGTYMRYMVLIDELADDTYEVSFRMKGRGEKFSVEFNGGEWTSANALMTAYTKEPTDENGWARYSREYKGKINRVHIAAWENTDAYIDDVQIVKKSDATKKNLFELSGFETGFTTVKTESREVIHPMAFAAKQGGALNISWTNPASTKIKGIDVYVDGNIVKNSVHNLSASAFNEMLVDGLENNKEYPIEIKVIFEDEVVTATTTGTPDMSGGMFVRGDWSYERFSDLVKNSAYREGQTYPDYANANFSLDENGAGYALKMDVNLPKIKANCYPNVYQYVTARKDTAYRFSMKYKAENIGWFGVTVQYIDYNEDGSIAHSSWVVKDIISSNAGVTTDGWQDYSLDLTDITCTQKHDGTNVCGHKFYDVDDMSEKTYTMRVVINCQRGCGAVWMDDIALHEMFGDVAVSENLYANGGFNYTYEIKEPSFKSNNNEIKNVTTGRIDAVAKIKNYAVDNLTGMIAVALYKDNELKEVNFVEKTFAPTLLSVPAEEITQNVVLPNDLSDGNYEVKLMYWDGVKTMDPHKAADVLTEAVEAEETAE